MSNKDAYKNDKNNPFINHTENLQYRSAISWCLLETWLKKVIKSIKNKSYLSSKK